MPLLPGKSNIGRNIQTEQAAGKPHDQAIAIALDVARRHRDSGGGVTDRKLFTGPIHSHVAGRTDHLNIHVPSGSYVLPADVVSAGGEGSTMAGFKTLRRVFGGEPYGAGEHPYGVSGGPYGEPLARKHGGRAAGVLFLSPDREVLLLKRAGDDHHGEWGLPAGHVEKGERPVEAAHRETREETGYDHDGGLSPFMHSAKHGTDFTTFIAHSGKFQPKLNDEHDDAKWATPDEADKLPLHPGVREALAKLRARKAHGGASNGVPIVAAGGEHVLSPEQVRVVGHGDMDLGHRVLDSFVKRVRKELISELQKLPGPRHD